MATETLVKDIVVAHPEAVPVLEDAGIDFCCSGEVPLAAACARANLTVDDLMHRIAQITYEEFQRRSGSLEESSQASNEAPILWEGRSLAELTQYIVTRHHAYTQEACERIAPLLKKVVEVHGERHPELHRVKEIFARMVRDFSEHLAEEETVVFPGIVRLESRGTGQPLGSEKQLVQNLRHDHRELGVMLDEIRGATSGYTVPSDGCESFRRLYRELQELAHDIHWHVHLENNILFPRALALVPRSGETSRA